MSHLFPSNLSSSTDDGDKIKELVSFYSEQWSKKRSVTSLDWSPKVSPPPVSLTTVPRIITSILHQKSLRTLRSRWNNKHMEHPLPLFPRIHIPLNLRHSNRKILPLPPKSHCRRILFRTHLTLRYSSSYTSSHSQDSTYRNGTYSSCIFCELCWDSRCKYDY
jgi:hypothetical protein